MRKNFILIAMLCWSGWSCTRAQTKDPNKSQTNLSDTTWNYTIMDADLVMKVIVMDQSFVTEAGSFKCYIVEVKKGSFQGEEVSFRLELIESSHTRYEARFRALTSGKKTPYRVAISFKETNDLKGDIEDPATKKKYNFFMSSGMW